MATTPEISVRLTGGALESARVASVVGREAMNELSRFVVVLDMAAVADLETLLLAQVGLVFEDPREESLRTILLVVTEVGHLESLPDDRESLEVVLEPSLAVLRECSGYRVFVEKTTLEIVTNVLRESHLDDQLDLRLSAKYGVRAHCVQYDETDWAFIERLLADEGISYWFEAIDDKPKLVLCDAIEGSGPIADPTTIPFRDESRMNAMRHLSAIEVVDEVCIGSVMVRAVDPRTPAVPIDGRAGSDFGAWFEYPARVTSVPEAKQRAQVRLEQLRRNARTVRCTGDVIRIASGHRLVVSGCADEDMNGELLVVSVEHRCGGGNGQYGNHPVMVPVASFQRPALPRWPAIANLEPAVTTGPSGTEIHVHDLGEVKLRFPWDRSGIRDDTSSWWMRTSQLNLGGSMLLPRVGWEVPVMYLRGSPDQPVVLGRLFNGQTAGPMALPAAKASTNFGSSSTPGGGGAHTVCLGDTGGSQSFAVNATFNQTEAVGGGRTTKIAADLTHSVGLSLFVGVHGGQTVTVGGSQTVDIGSESITGIGGARTVMVGGAEINKVGGNRSVVTGPYSETIGALQGTLCNQHNSEVLGAYVQTVGGAALLQCALGSGETVLGGRMHDVGGALSFTVVNYNGGSIGPNSITSGDSSIVVAGGAVATNGASISETVGTLTVSASADVVLESGGAMTVDISGEITTPSATLGGGQIKITKGGEKLDGDVTRSGATVISS